MIVMMMMRMAEALTMIAVAGVYSRVFVVVLVFVSGLLSKLQVVDDGKGRGDA